MKKFSIIITLIFGLSLIMACDDSSEPAVKDYEEDAAQMVAMSYSDGSTDEITMMTEAADTAEADSGISGNYSATITGAGGSSTFNYDYTFSDCGTGTCDDMDWQGAHTGSWSWDRLSYSFERSYELHLSGCATDTITVNGQGSSSLDFEFSALYFIFERHYHANYSHEYQDVVISAANPYPLSGKVVFNIDGERTRTTKRKQATGSFSARAELTFNGTSTPVLVINSSRTYNLSLTAGTVTEI